MGRDIAGTLEEADDARRVLTLDANHEPEEGGDGCPDEDVQPDARFMSFYKPGVTEWYQSHIDCRTKPR